MAKKIAIAFEIKRSGVESDPLVIEGNPEFFSEKYQITLKDSQLFLTIRNCTFKHLKLMKCSNIAFEHCYFNYLALKRCSELKIKDCTFNSISISKSVFINLKNSKIIELSIDDSFLNSLENCTLTNIKIFRSPDNIIDGKPLTSEKKGKKLRFPNYFHVVMSSIIVNSYICSFIKKEIYKKRLNILRKQWNSTLIFLKRGSN